MAIPSQIADFVLVYFTFMDLPSTKAHALQIIKTCTALTHLGVNVDLVVSDLRQNIEDIWSQYGVTPLNNKLRILPIENKRRALSLLLHRKAVAYTRSTRWVKFLLDFKWLHRSPVVFETHRKSLYYPRDLETGIAHATSGEMRKLDSIFRKADGVVCAHGSTWAQLRGNNVKSLLLWYGWSHSAPEATGPPWKVGYASSKEHGFITEAASLTSGLEIHIFGGSRAEIIQVGGSRVVFHPFLSHSNLLRNLREVGIMISLDEGLKLGDYLSLSGAIVAPRMPSTLEILNRAALYFSYGSVASLAKALQDIRDNTRLFEALKSSASVRSRFYRWPYKAMKLKQFLSSFWSE